MLTLRSANRVRYSTKVRGIPSLRGLFGMNRTGTSTAASVRNHIAVVALLGVFNAALFSVIGCPSRCGLESCAQQLGSSSHTRFADRKCQACAPARPNQPSNHSDSGCSHQSYIVLGVSTTAGSSVAPEPHTVRWASLSASTNFGFANSATSIPDSSQSPPTLLTGRMICRHQSLLRI